MQLKNNQSTYGLLAIVLHWISAISVIGLFALGFWMVELDYYHDWYTTGPYWHKGLGILFIFILVFRIIWKAINTKPRSLLSSTWLNTVVDCTHILLYLLMILISVTGYLIVAADGRELDVLGLFNLPADIALFDQQESLMGDWHRYLAYLLIGLVVMHLGAAIKHHFVDKDATLRRMLGIHNKE